MLSAHPPYTRLLTPQLLTMKEQSDNKVPLVKMSKDDPLDQVDSDNNILGESNMIKEKDIKNP